LRFLGFEELSFEVSIRIRFCVFEVSWFEGFEVLRLTGFKESRFLRFEVS
jgi:hypothetical protein